MIKILRIAIAIASLQLTMNVAAQYNSFPTSDAEWFEEFFNSPFPTGSNSFFMPSGLNDTLINGNVYYKLYIPSGASSAVRGAIKDSGGGQVYFFDYSDSTEYLLYDFEVQIGDTLTNIYNERYNVDSFQVTLVDTVFLGGISRKRITIESIGILPGGIGQWIEGIGGRNGLLSTCACSNVSGAYYLNCMSHLDTIRFGQGEGLPGTCFPINSVDDLPREEDNWILHEVPGSAGIYRIENMNLSAAFVYTSSGTIVQETQLNRIDLRGFNEGIYLLRATSIDGRSKTFKVLHVRE